MEKVSKKEVKKIVQAAMNNALAQIEVLKPSRKTKKLLKKVSRKLSSEVRNNLKKKSKSHRKNGATKNVPATKASA